MKRVFFLILTLIATNSIAQSLEKTVHIIAPSGYQIYFDNEYMGDTENETGGLSFNTELAFASLEVKKQDKLIVYKRLELNENTIVFNLNKYLKKDTKKGFYEYWQELFDLLEYSLPIDNRTFRKNALMLAKLEVELKSNEKVKAFLEKEKKIEIGYPLVVNDGFYYAKLADVKKIGRTLEYFFILIFLQDKNEYIPILRVEVTKNMHQVVHSFSGKQAQYELLHYKENSNLNYFGNDENPQRTYDYYPNLGIMELIWPYQYSGFLGLDLTIIDGEIYFRMVGASKDSYEGILNFQSW